MTTGRINQACSSPQDPAPSDEHQDGPGRLGKLVYLAGRDSDWFFLANESESKTWPVYREHYERWVSRAARGEVLEGPERVALSAPTQEALSAEEQVTHLARLRKEIGL